MITIACFGVFSLTFPDSIAVFNPFKEKIGLRGINYLDSFWIFASTWLVVLALIVNSLVFLGPTGWASKNMQHNVYICFSLTLLKSDYWAYLGCVLPFVIFFSALVWAYSLANALGVSLMYIGIINYYQTIQFF
jgi:hypothetical protein